MEVLLLTLIPIVFLLVLTGALTQAVQQEKDWALAAETLGLTHTSGERGAEQLKGLLDGYAVTARSFIEPEELGSRMVAFEVRASLPERLELRPDGVLNVLTRQMEGPGLTLGLPDFDARVYMKGPEREALALLNDDARAAILELMDEGGAIANGVLSVVTYGPISDVETLSAKLRKLVSLMARINPVGDFATRLQKNAVEDAEPTMRLRCLEALLVSAPMHDATREATKRCLEDADPSVALRAALAAGDLDRAEAIMRSEKDILLSVRIDGLSALGVRGEARLISMLESPDQEAALAAAQALERGGTLAAVEHLLPHSEGLLRPEALKRASERAIAAIQARHGSGERGGLSLTESTRGAISTIKESPWNS